MTPTRQIKLIAAVFFFLACCSMRAQPARVQPHSSAESAMSGPYRIAGILVNATTDEPVRRATVEALNETDSHAVASSVTDNEGRFVLTGLAAAKYQLTASKRGFRTSSYDEHEEFSTAIVTGPDQDTSQLHFRLMPRSVVRGTVTADDGEPVAGARVLLFQRPKHPGDGPRTVQVDATVTDDTGAYEFGDLPAGEYLLAVNAEPWYAVHEGSPAKRNPALDVAYPVTYFDSTTDEASATPIALAGGAREEANINLHAVPALRLSIAVPRKSNGSLVRPQLEQTIFGTVVGAESSGFIDAIQTGSVEMSGIAPGHYQLSQGEPPRIMDLDLSSSLEVDPNAGSTAISLSGRLRMASGAPISSDPTISLARMDSGVGQQLYAAQSSQGLFSIDGVPPGRWALMATGSGEPIPVVAVSTGTVQQPGNLVTLRNRNTNLVVTLAQSETRVEGVARKDGKGVSGAMIVLLPRNPAQWSSLTRRDQSDSDGSFALKNVSPGEYTLVAIEDGWKIDWTSPEAMARYLPGGTHVTVTDKSGALLHLGSPVTTQTP